MHREHARECRRQQGAQIRCGVLHVGLDHLRGALVLRARRVPRAQRDVHQPFADEAHRGAVVELQRYAEVCFPPGDARVDRSRHVKRLRVLRPDCGCLLGFVRAVDELCFVDGALGFRNQS